jgi:copper chaperone CopZ
MNSFKSVTLAAVAALAFAACKDTAKDGNTETPQQTVTDSTQVKNTAAANTKTTFKIDGMTCPEGCAATIQNKLSAMEGVEKAEVDFEKKTATVDFDDAKQKPEAIVKTVEAIADGAYKVSDVKTEPIKA